MQFSTVLTDFSGPKQFADEGTSVAPEALEDEKLKSFEDGYSAGWDDAMKAQEERGKKLSSALNDAVETASVSKEQAFSAFSQANAEFLNALLNLAFPQVSPNILAFHVKDVIVKYGIDVSDVACELLVSEKQFEVVSGCAKDLELQDLKIVASNKIELDCALMKYHTQEKSIDLDELFGVLRSLCEHLATSQNEESASV